MPERLHTENQHPVPAPHKVRDQPGDLPRLVVDRVPVVDGEVDVEMVLGHRRGPCVLPVIERYDRVHSE
jgi:hypothetical protein